LSACVFMLISLINESNVLEKRNFSVGFLFLSIVGLSPLTSAFIPTLVALLIFLKVLLVSLGALREKESVEDFFNIGFFLSVASLFYFNVLFFAVLFFISKLLFRRQSGREWFAMLAGLILPYTILALLEYIVFGEIIFEKKFASYFEHNVGKRVFGTSLVGYALVLIVSAFAGIAMLSRYYRLNILTRDYMKFFITELLVTASVYLVIPSAGIEILMFAALSLAIPLSDFFNIKKYIRLKSLLFFILIGLIVLVQAEIKPTELYDFRNMLSKISF